jgi:hypothetical protein
MIKQLFAALIIGGLISAGLTGLIPAENAVCIGIAAFAFCLSLFNLKYLS